MLMEFVRFVVFAICLIIAFTLVFYLSELIAKGEEWGDSEGFLILSPLLIVTILFGFFTENFKRIISHSIIAGVLLTLVFYFESVFFPHQSQPDPDIVDLAHLSPFPYLFAIFGFMLLILVLPMAIGFILGIIKRKIFT